MPTFHIEQFGCRATQADGAALEHQLLLRGYTPSAEGTADIVVINTCTVTAAADAQARDAIRKIRAQNQRARVVVTGCYAQRAPEELAALPGVAWVVGNSHKPDLPEVIGNLFAPSSPPNFVPAALLQNALQPELQKPAGILIGDFVRKPLLSAPVFGGEGNHTRPTLKIQDGCNSHCSYCIIPQVRGKSRSLPAAIVVREINQLTSSGIREIVLSGINLGNYGRDLEPRVSFESLLRRILDETPLERLRISSIEPMDVTNDLVDFFAANDRIAQHFHMPLQSGSDRILAAMHRWYRAEHYARRAQLICERLPHAAIGADVIAGFPGETEAEHSTTVSFIENLPFTYLHVFSFSKRPGTTAAKLSGEVPAQIINRRARELRALGEIKSAAFRASHLGERLRVLTLRPGNADESISLASDVRESRASSSYTPAISNNYLRVRIPGSWPVNQWLNVEIDSAAGNYLTGKPQESSDLEAIAHTSR